MKWTVTFHEEFEPEFDELPQEVKDELYAEAAFVEKFGPETGRPHQRSGAGNLITLPSKEGNSDGTVIPSKTNTSPPSAKLRIR